LQIVGSVSGQLGRPDLIFTWKIQTPAANALEEHRPGARAGCGQAHQAVK
jgi:hypothetical protein